MNVPAAYTAQDILDLFDARLAKWRFIVLDGGKERPADVRMTIYRDDHRWAVVQEELASDSSGGHRGIVNQLFKMGNCIAEKPGPSREDRVKVTGDGPDEPAFLPPFQVEVNRNVRFIRIRDKIVPVDLSPEALERKGIPLPTAVDVRYLRDGVQVTERYEATLGGEHLLWSLLPENRDTLLATEEEKRERVPTDLPKFMQVEEWNHPKFLTEHLKPSDSETFCLLAEAIAVGDAALYRPTLPSNTHWKNWLGYERV